MTKMKICICGTSHNTKSCPKCGLRFTTGKFFKGDSNNGFEGTRDTEQGVFGKNSHNNKEG